METPDSYVGEIGLPSLAPLSVSETSTTSPAGLRPAAPDGRSFILKVDSRFRHFPELDGLRGVAVLLVLVGHILVFRLGRGHMWTQFAKLGVLIFFVLSGFLITGLLCSEQQRFKGISLKQFYLRRVYRILPALSFFILVVSALICFQLVTDTSWRTVTASAFFLKNIFGSGLTLGHLWSLSIEEQFYLIWPIFCALLGRRRAFAPTLGLILGIVVYRATAIRIAPYDYGLGVFELRSDFRMDSILFGCALALFLDRRRAGVNPFPPIARWGTHPFWTIPVLFVWTLYCDIPPLWWSYLTLQTLLVVGLVFHVLVFPDSLTGRLLSARWICLVGLVSYSLYLWQQLFVVVSVPDWGFIRRLPFCLFAAGGVAVFSYFFVERPFLGLKRRFSSAR
jgi:peptidoglycan/LPS O-acetylase OafA/YrhL